jgi:hypothetical protein
MEVDVQYGLPYSFTHIDAQIKARRGAFLDQERANLVSKHQKGLAFSVVCLEPVCYVAARNQKGMAGRYRVTVIERERQISLDQGLFDPAKWALVHI